MRGLFSFLLLLTTCSLLAQSPSVKWEGGVAAIHQWNDKWTLKTSLLLRETFNKYASETVKPFVDRYEAKAFIDYALTDKHKVGMGYTFRQNNPFQKDLKVENRISQHYSYSTQYLTHKLRVEERIFRKTTAIRIRYQLTFEKAIGENQQTILILADELLSNFINNKQSFENRLDFGIAKKFTNGRKLKILISNRNENLFKDSKKHILQLITVYSFII